MTDDTGIPAMTTKSDPNDRNLSRIERARMPLAKEVLESVALQFGVCLRPMAMRRIDTTTGATEIIPVPCGARLASKCEPCAKKAKALRLTQCREGWHLNEEPPLESDDPTELQQQLATARADAQSHRDELAGQLGADHPDVAAMDHQLAEVDEQLRQAGVRGTLTDKATRRTRSTKRRQDAAELPRMKVDKRTVGRTYTANDGAVWRPSMFITLTCDSYGRVGPDGAPVNGSTYDYRRAARDAIHFPKLVDRFWQNLRRAVGWDVQYFASLEPQRRLAPHLHAAIRGTIPRALIKQVAAATYHQVWWPACDEPAYLPGNLPVWDDQLGAYVDPDNGNTLPTWDQALDEIGEDDEPAHVVRFGAQVDAKGVEAGTERADLLIGYLGKYLTKQLDECHEATTDRQKAHLDRYADALRFEPCSPTCANWLLYGVQPKNSRAGLTPGHCKGRVHRRATLGFGGRRVLLSRKWSGKTLTDTRNDRRRWVLGMIQKLQHHNGDQAHVEVSATENPDRYAWERLSTSDTDAIGRRQLLMHAIADRQRWRRELDQAQALAAGQLPATEAAA